jgi:hypothetical protein
MGVIRYSVGNRVRAMRQAEAISAPAVIAVTGLTFSCRQAFPFRAEPSRLNAVINKRLFFGVSAGVYAILVLWLGG